MLSIGQQIHYLDAAPGEGQLIYLGAYTATGASHPERGSVQHLFAVPTGKDGKSFSIVTKWHEDLQNDILAHRVALTEIWMTWKLTLSDRVDNLRDDERTTPSEGDSKSATLFKRWERTPNAAWKARQKSRLTKLQPILARLDELLGREAPQQALDAELRAHKLNTTRYRSLVVAYLASGKNLNVLYPDFFRCGGRGKQRFSKNAPLGRPPSRHANGERSKPTITMTADMRERIIDSYHAHCRVGRPMSDIRTRALLTHFSHRIEGEGSRMRYVKDPTIPQPTLSQYEYWVRKHLASPKLQRARLGGKDYAQRKEPRPHKFVETLTYSGQRLEADASGAKQTVVSLLNRTRELPAMMTARSVCVLTSVIWGVGFSLRGEDKDLYRMLMYCMGTDKVQFCANWGIEITPEQWPVAGFGAGIHLDRGPGMQEALYPLWEAHFQRAQFVQGGRGDRKGTVETVHDKTRRRYGKIIPSIPRTAHEIIRSTIFDVLEWNATADMRHKLTPDMIRAKVEPTPLGIHRYLADQGRVIMRPVNEDYLVKQFLHRGKGSLHEDGVHFLGQRYMSGKLHETGLLHRAKRGALEVPLYYLNLAPRCIYLPHGDDLYKLNMRLLQDDDTLLEMSEDDLKVSREALAAIVRDSADRRDAEAVHWTAMRDSDEQNAKAKNRTARIGARSHDIN